MRPNRRARLTRWLGAVRDGVSPLLLLVAVSVIGLGIVLTGIQPAPARPARPVLLASGTWAPFVDPSMPGGGPLAELVTLVFESNGYQPSVRHTSWSQALERTISGEMIGAFPMVASAARSADFVASDPLISFNYVLFFNRADGEPSIETAGDLAGLRVAQIDGYDYWPELEASDAEFVNYPTSFEAFEALAAGKLDLVPEGVLSGQAILLSEGFSGDRAGFDYIRGNDPIIGSSQGLHFMMPRSAASADLMAEFNDALAVIKHSEEYAAIAGGLSGALSRTEITLAGIADSDLPRLHAEDGTVVGMTPRGTRASVIEWPHEFGGDTADVPILIKVKLLDGPSAGRVLYVNALAVTMAGGS